MKIECYLSIGCGSEQSLKKNIQQALELEGMAAQTIFRRVTDEEARLMGLKGSPSVLIDGKDMEPQELAGFS